MNRTHNRLCHGKNFALQLVHVRVFAGLTSGFASDDSISQMSEVEKKEMYHTAKSRRKELQESLKLKLAKLKQLCLQEAVGRS